MLKPDYQRDGVTLYCGDALEVLPVVAAVLVMDPPYGIDYTSGHEGELPRSIVGDADTTLRDAVLSLWGDRPAIVFGSWKRPRPAATHTRLIWEKNVGGMGDLSVPWKPLDEEIYVIGHGYRGRRTSNVLRAETVVTWNSRGRQHPHEKPVGLLRELVGKCPGGVILDPFMGSGTTGVACVQAGRKFVGIEIHRPYFDIAVRRIDAELRQGRLPFPTAPPAS